MKNTNNTIFFFLNYILMILYYLCLSIDFSKFAHQDWLKKCQLVFSGRNLWTSTKYGGMDPEISSGQSNSAFDRGRSQYHSKLESIPGYIESWLLIRKLKI